MTVPTLLTAQKMKFSIKDFFSKCDQIRFLIENFFFCAVTFAILISHEDTSACNFTKSNTPPPWMIFTFSKLHKWSKSAQSMTCEDRKNNMGNVHEMGKISNIRSVIYYRNYSQSTLTELLTEFYNYPCG